MATLFMNPDSSRCGNCRLGADPKESAHTTVLSYAEGGVACGETFTAVSSDYRLGPELVEAIRDHRPDLPLVNPDGSPFTLSN